MTDQELRDLVAENSLAIKEMREENRQRDREWNERFAKTEKKLDEVSEKLKNTTKLLGSIGINIGAAAEEFFYSSLEESKELGGIKFDKVEKTIRKTANSVEYDIVLINGNSIGIVEVKYKAHKSDIEDLVTRKLTTYRRLYENHKNIYLGLATMSVYDNIEVEARDRGICLMTQKGNHLEMSSDNMIAY